MMKPFLINRMEELQITLAEGVENRSGFIFLTFTETMIELYENNHIDHYNLSVRVLNALEWRKERLLGSSMIFKSFEEMYKDLNLSNHEMYVEFLEWPTSKQD